MIIAARPPRGKRRIDGRRQRHGNAMTSVRIVDRFQDTAGPSAAPRRNFPLACWNARKFCVRQVADGERPDAIPQQQGDRFFFPAQTAKLDRLATAKIGEAGSQLLLLASSPYNPLDLGR